MKPTASLCGALRRTRLTTKQARKGYYKGTGTGILGHWDPANPRKFVVDWEKVRTFKYPEMGLDNFPLTPFVSAKVSKFEEVEDGVFKVPLKKLTGEMYLEMWKEKGGYDMVADPVEMAAEAEKKR